jgi:chemotaxis protein histidine kinase CheA
VQSTKQEQIVGYFVEEARDHLDTLEKGLLDLQATVDDPEIINELFRAAHSVKGGAAMLGFDSIHKTAHHLEDCLKVLKDNPVTIDQKLESFFLKGFDALKELTESIQGPYGFQEEAAQQIFKDVEPAFAQLQAHLQSLVKGGSPAVAQPSVEYILPANFTLQVNDGLRQILGIFKQAPTPDSRQRIVALCDQLAHLCPEIVSWRSLIQVTQRAISDSRNSFATLAPLVIKELKQASDLLQARRPTMISVGADLQKLADSAPDVSTQPQRITIPLEPQAAARVLVECFNKQQLREIAQILVTALKA